MTTRALDPQARDYLVKILSRLHSPFGGEQAGAGLKASERSMQSWHGPPTPKQRAWLQRIYSAVVL